MKNCFSDLHKFKRDPLEFLLEKGAAEHCSLVPLYLGSKSYLVANPDLLKLIQPITAGVTSRGSVFHKLKQKTQSSESRSQELKEAAYTHFASTLLNKNTEAVTAIIRENIFKLAGRRVFSTNEVMGPLALCIISSLIFGPSVISQADQYAFIKAVKLVDEQMIHPVNRVLPDVECGAREIAQVKTAKNIVRLIIERLRANAVEGSLARSMEIQGLDDKALNNEILAILLIGYYQIGGAACWILYFLSVQNGLQENLAQEAESISDSIGELNPSVLKSSRGSFSLVHEILRLYPTVWWSSRVVVEETWIEGCRLSPGTSLVVSPWQLGRDPRYWDNPFEFDIGRSYETPAFCPFGAGPRSNITASIGISILQLIALSFTSCYRLEYKSHFPAPPPIVSGALLPPDMSIRM